jgi:hypothetical protein
MKDDVINQAFELYYNDWKNHISREYVPNMWAFENLLSNQLQKQYVEEAIHIIKLKKLLKIKKKINDSTK